MSRSTRQTKAGSKAPKEKVKIDRAEWPVAVLALLGVWITGYLLLANLQALTPVGCGPDSACAVIQQSQWSILLGLPVTMWGLGLYGLILVIALALPPKLSRWRKLVTLAVFGLLFSVYLNLVGWLALEALCRWCAASLLTLLLMVVWLLLRRPKVAPGSGWAAFGLARLGPMLLIIVAIHAHYAGWFEPPEDPRLRALAEHIGASDGLFYGAFWCASCAEQKRLFGPAERHLPYVECSPNGRRGGVALECVTNQISTYPTWIIGRRVLTGVQTPEQLARYTRFDWDGWQAPESPTAD